MAFEKRSVISQVFGVTGRACGLFLVVGTVFGTAGWFSDGLVLVVGSLGLGFVVLGGGGLVRLTARPAARCICVRPGPRAGHLMLAREATNVKFNNRRPWRIRWQDDSGALGQSLIQSPDGLPQAGARITVHADPEGTASVWEGDCDTRQGA